MRNVRFLFVVFLFFCLCISGTFSVYANKQEEGGKKYKIPSSVLNVTKENTYPNPSQDLPKLQPSELTQQLLETSNVKIENPDLIRILNESSISKPFIALRHHATIYLGNWPLNYVSKETSANWEYQKINTNFYDNRNGKAPYKIHYVQEMQKLVKGGLTAKVPNAGDVKKMMLLKATEKTNLPLSFETIIGASTKKDQYYNIPIRKLGYLDAYAPAINEKGTVTYGEVYLVLKGGKKKLTVKNVTSQGIGAWIPIQDHVTFKFNAVESPR
ncbi:YfkD famly protein [Fervidibacillus albus]|uniref:YfkD family protein n=1 Tax=Fervidibacillus albus TaxID=2980026 RepID=A0A9E8LT07_9BACI|nr:YfkD famly protein [Fervidibacillus albus]WAA08992.1 YfkD family protein [Fervidibacillus albus]